MTLQIKICCISDRQEADLAIGSGADVLGLVSQMPSGPGVISDHEISDIVQHIPTAVGSFLLTSKTSWPEIVSHHQKIGTSAIQLVDSVGIMGLVELRKALSGVQLVQVVHVIGEESVDRALEWSEHVDFLLLDSGNPNASVKELGGTGRVHDWTLSRRIVDQSQVPVFLAGGLNAANVRSAVDTVRPFGVDLCSGVRKDGKLNARRLDEFMKAVAAIQ